MDAEPPPPRLSGAALPPILAGLFAIGIFVVDTFIELSGAVAVLYVVVVLVAARHFPRRGVLLVASACLGLTVLSYALQHRFAINAAFVRCIMSLAAIVITTFLALRNQAANAVLRERAELLDLRNKAQEALHEAQAQLAHVTRVMTLGELAASIAHEVNQPLAAIVTNGEAGLRWLGHATPNTDEARRSLKRIVSDAERASQVIKRIRNLSRKADPEKAPLDINDVVDDVIPLVQRAALSHRTALQRRLAPGLPPVLGDRVQLQQVVINLIVNGIEAMADVADRPREIVIRSRRGEGGEVIVEIEDAGIGIEPAQAARLFNAFYTTKRDGMGMGLSICRSIIEAHGGRISARPNTPHGAVFQVILPTAP